MPRSRTAPVLSGPSRSGLARDSLTPMCRSLQDFREERLPRPARWSEGSAEAVQNGRQTVRSGDAGFRRGRLAATGARRDAGRRALRARPGRCGRQRRLPGRGADLPSQPRLLLHHLRARNQSPSALRRVRDGSRLPGCLLRVPVRDVHGGNLRRGRRSRERERRLHPDRPLLGHRLLLLRRLHDDRLRPRPACSPCVGGICTPLPENGSCGRGLNCCGGECVDLGSDPTHCGSCPNACPTPSECLMAVCADRVCGAAPDPDKESDACTPDDPCLLFGYCHSGVCASSGPKCGVCQTCAAGVCQDVENGTSCPAGVCQGGVCG